MRRHGRQHLTPHGIEEDTIDAPCMTPRKRRQTPYENIWRISTTSGISTLNSQVVIAPLLSEDSQIFAYARVIRG